MHLVKLQLRKTTPFFFLKSAKISLTPENPVSDTIDMDGLSKKDRDIIQSSIKFTRAIKVIEENIDAPAQIAGETRVSVDDIKEIEPEQPKIVSATVSSEEEKPKVEISYSEEDLEEARIFLNKNGNIVKAAIKKVNFTKDTVRFLLACFEAENHNKGRKGIIEAIRSKLIEIKKHDKGLFLE